jgi:hypothetical protein
MYKILSLLLFLGVFQCDKTEISAEKGLAGEWRYVGTFSNLADYKCFVCDDFDYEKSIYKLTFADANNYTAKISLLVAKGEYNTSFDVVNDKEMNGTFENLNMQILNKPYETEADSKFQSMFVESTNFSLSLKSGNNAFDQLTLASNNNEYLLFVRK